MSKSKLQFDAIIIGAGFFGSVLSDFLVNQKKLSKVAVVEKEVTNFQRASSRNQARIHRGYHYPRSLSTANASRRSYELFKTKWPSSVFGNFRHVYAIARHGSKVAPNQFESTMRAIGAPLRKLSKQELGEIFDPGRVESAYDVTEETFNHQELGYWCQEVLTKPEVDVFYNEKVVEVKRSGELLDVACESNLRLSARYVFNVSYSGLANISGLGEELRNKIVHELTEMNLVSMGDDLSKTAFTVMDGPFFSLVPYPTLKTTSTLSHVRYTPLVRILGSPEINPYQHLDKLETPSYSFDVMKREASLFIPALSNLCFEGVLREVKTVLTNSVQDDSRPILFFRHRERNVYSILGGKIDNVFDMLDRLNQEKIK